MEENKGGGWRSGAWRSSKGPGTGKGEAEVVTCRRTEDARGGGSAWAVVAIVGRSDGKKGRTVRAQRKQYNFLIIQMFLK
jgi:hypothetical protein